MSEKSQNEQNSSSQDKPRKKFGTFSGVFTPTLLTILGVILYLREGAVVGNAGLIGAILIITIAFGISACTALSLSTITTNIRIGAGGAYSVISKSLGLEVGGGIGIPFYLSQGLATAMYVIGFREGWRLVFPEHPAIYVDFITFGVLFVIAFISANLAFKIQYIILAIILFSLIAIFDSVFGVIFTPLFNLIPDSFLNSYYGSYLGSANFIPLDQLNQPTYWGDFKGFPENNFSGTNFWFVFAVFFPAATGIMAGANMSGDLESPKKSVPLGTLAAIGVSYIVYIAVAVWLSFVATPQELVENYTVLIDKSAWKPAVIAGLLGATFSSGLSCLVGAPRILQALAEHGVTFFAQDKLAKAGSNGEPRNALLFTGVIVSVALMMRELTAVAAMITMFLLLTYATINAVVLIKQSLGLISFRPTFRIPKFVPIVGMLGCLIAMFIIDPIFSVISIIVVAGLYYFIRKRDLDKPFGDVRSGLLISVTEWWSRKIAQLAQQKGRAWKPNLLIPIEDAQNFRGKFRLLYDIANPKGSIYLIGLADDLDQSPLKGELPKLVESLKKEDIFAYSTIVKSRDFGDDLITTMQVMSGSFLRPNIIFLPMLDEENYQREADLLKIIERANANNLGVILFAEHPKARLSHKHKLNVWVSDQKEDWDAVQGESNIDLALLLAYQIQQNWEGEIKVLTGVGDSEHLELATEHLEDLVEYARLQNAEIDVCEGDFDKCLEQAPRADLNIFGLPDEIDFKFIREMVEKTSSTCIFIRDSGDEDVLA